jgi:hypothetical protein
MSALAVKAAAKNADAILEIGKNRRKAVKKSNGKIVEVEG